MEASSEFREFLTLEVQWKSCGKESNNNIIIKLFDQICTVFC